MAEPDSVGRIEGLVDRLKKRYRTAGIVNYNIECVDEVRDIHICILSLSGDGIEIKITKIGESKEDALNKAGYVMKESIASNCKDPENRSKKDCCCGGHNIGNPKSSKRHITAKRKKQRVEKKELDHSYKAIDYNGWNPVEELPVMLDDDDRYGVSGCGQRGY